LRAFLSFSLGVGGGGSEKEMGGFVASIIDAGEGRKGKSCSDGGTVKRGRGGGGEKERRWGVQKSIPGSTARRDGTEKKKKRKRRRAVVLFLFSLLRKRKKEKGGGEEEKSAKLVLPTFLAGVDSMVREGGKGEKKECGGVLFYSAYALAPGKREERKKRGGRKDAERFGRSVRAQMSDLITRIKMSF